MYLSVERFTNSCSFDFSLDEDESWTSCTASFHPAPTQPFRLKLSSAYFGDISYVFTPLDNYSCILTDIDEERSCLFNPSNCYGDIAEDINEIIEDEEMSSLIAYTFKYLCRPNMR